MSTKKNSFAEKIQKRLADAARGKIPTGGTWRKNPRQYDHICINLADNFIDGIVPGKFNVKGPDTVDGKKVGKADFHDGARHLNSSQIVCISFFKKFFENEVWENFLLKLLNQNGIKVNGSVANAIFEYVPDANERTNFDFYLIFPDGKHVSMEIKYTEAEFGPINPDPKKPDKYLDKWTNIYETMVKKSVYLDCDMDDFYSNYQINRNIAYAGPGDYVIFLTPRANDAPGIQSGRAYIDEIHEQFPNIMNLYWEDLVQELEALIGGEPELADYYGKFREKYIDILK